LALKLGYLELRLFNRNSIFLANLDNENACHNLCQRSNLMLNIAIIGS